MFTKEEIFNIIDNLLQDCYNETIDREDDLLDETLAGLIYDNVELFTERLKDKLTDEVVE